MGGAITAEFDNAPPRSDIDDEWHPRELLYWTGIPATAAVSEQSIGKVRVMSGIPSTYRTPHGLSAELRRLVLEESSVTLGTINPDGSPHMTLLLFLLDDSDRLYLPTPRSTRKVKNLLARPTATALVRLEDGWVSCTGEARVIEGPDAAMINQQVRERLFTNTGLATMGRFLEAHEDATIEITPTKWLSWNSDGILPWIESQGIDLEANPPGTWSKDLTAEH